MRPDDTSERNPPIFAGHHRVRPPSRHPIRPSCESPSWERERCRNSNVQLGFFRSYVRVFSEWPLDRTRLDVRSQQPGNCFRIGKASEHGFWSFNLTEDVFTKLQGCSPGKDVGNAAVVAVDNEDGTVFQLPQDYRRHAQGDTHIPSEIGKLCHIAESSLGDKNVVQFHSPGIDPAAECPWLRATLGNKPLCDDAIRSAVH